MIDIEILELYKARDQRAIKETDKVYGKYCRTVSYNILHSREDAEEVTQDGYMQAWNSIPPTIPQCLRSWLVKTVRNLSINVWKRDHAKKRYSGMDIILDELAECIPSPVNIERQIEDKEIVRLLNEWLKSLSDGDRMAFVKRYFMGESVTDIAHNLGISPNKLAGKMFGLRKQLKAFLEKEDVII